MRLYPPAGLAALPAGSLTELAYSATSVGIGAAADNRAPLNLASVAGISKLIHQINLTVVSQANLELQLQFEWHRPDHTLHSAIVTQFRLAATGAGDIFGVSMHLAVDDIAPQVGDYHFNTTLTAGGGTQSVNAHRLIGVV